MYLFRSHLSPYLEQHQTRIESSVDQALDMGRRTLGVPGAGLERLAALCRSSGIPLGSDDSNGCSSSADDDEHKHIDKENNKP